PHRTTGAESGLQHGRQSRQIHAVENSARNLSRRLAPTHWASPTSPTPAWNNSLQFKHNKHTQKICILLNQHQDTKIHAQRKAHQLHQKTNPRTMASKLQEAHLAGHTTPYTPHHRRKTLPTDSRQGFSFHSWVLQRQLSAPTVGREPSVGGRCGGSAPPAGPMMQVLQGVSFHSRVLQGNCRPRL
ncbi:hypothetical protein KC19_VG339600, partial [Ceratodon purpureus]